MQHLIQLVLGYAKFNKALIVSLWDYRGKELVLAGLTAIFILSPISTASENHENTAQAATIEMRAIRVWVTAYSSTEEETDDTPFITASGKIVRDGILAANFLPLGTKVRIPEYFGDKIFVVEDRMHRRKTNFVDIWMPTKEDALRFGIARTDIFVLE